MMVLYNMVVSCTKQHIGYHEHEHAGKGYGCVLWFTRWSTTSGKNVRCAFVLDTEGCVWWDAMCKPVRVEMLMSRT